MIKQTLDLSFPTLDELRITKKTKDSGSGAKAVQTIAPVAVKAPKVRVACYARVSTDHEDQKSSITIQRQHFASLAAKEKDWEFVGVYYDIMSGTKKEKRPNLNRLLDDCRAGRVNLILIKSISRLARNTTDTLSIVREMTATGVGIIFDREKIDTRKMNSELLLTILASMAEEESHSYAANNRWAIQKRFKDGSYKRSVAPYGYDLVRSELVINETEAKVVRFIFSEFLSGKGCRIIANTLNEMGIPTKRSGEIQKDGKTTSGLWDSSCIVDMLRNEAYIGDSLLQKTYKDSQFRTRHNKGEQPQYYYEDHHEPIIDRESFERVSALLCQHRKECGMKPRQAHAHYTFSDKIVCGACGTLMWRCKDTRKNNKRNYWMCAKHKKGANACSMKRVMEENIENCFTTMMNKLYYCAVVIYAFIEGKRQSWREKHASELERLENQLAMVNINQANLRAQRSRMEVPLFLTQMNKWTQAEAETRAEIDLLADDQLTEGERLMEVVQGWKSRKDFAVEVFNSVIDRVVILDREDFEFHFKCGLVLREKVYHPEEKPTADMYTTEPIKVMERTPNN